MNDSLFQLAAGGALTVLILKAVFGFLKDRRPPLREPNPHPESTTTGELSAEYWLDQFSQIKGGLNRIETLLRERLPRRE